MYYIIYKLEQKESGRHKTVLLAKISWVNKQFFNYDYSETHIKPKIHATNAVLPLTSALYV